MKNEIIADLPWQLNLTQLPGILGIGVGSLDSGWNAFKAQSFCSLHLYSQEAEMQYGEQILHLQSGSLSFTPAGREIIYFNPSKTSKHIYVHLELPGMFQASAAAIHLSPKEHQRVQLDLQEALGIYPTDPLRTRVRIWDILLRYNHGQRIAIIDRVIRYIEEKLHLTMKVSSLARSFELSADHLNRLVKSHTGKTLSTYILERRIDRACSLIRNTDQPIKRIAYQVGISNPQTFNKVFRREKGVSPRAWRMLDRVKGMGLNAKGG